MLSVPRKGREQPPRREPERKHTVERENNLGKKKQVLGFEDFLKKKPSKAVPKTQAERVAENRAIVYRGRVSGDGKHKTEPPKSKSSNLKKRDERNFEQEFQPVETKDKKEVSLENIFDSRLMQDDQRQPEPRPDFGNASEIRPSNQGGVITSVANRSQVEYVTDRAEHGRPAPRERSLDEVAAEAREYLTADRDDAASPSKNIRGTFKKEIYGNDENRKKENQIRMRKELEKQMEENRLKKDQEKRRKAEEEKIENEKYQKYLELEKKKKDEEDQKEQEKKKKKEIFNVQQAALLEEYKQNVTNEKKLKHGKKSVIMDQSSEHIERIQVGAQSVKPSLQVPVSQGVDMGSIQSHLNTNNTGYAHYAGQTNPTIVTVENDLHTGYHFGAGS